MSARARSRAATSTPEGGTDGTAGERRGEERRLSGQIREALARATSLSSVEAVETLDDRRASDGGESQAEEQDR